VAGAPDYAGSLCGWRAWLLVERGRELALRSVVYPTMWPPHEALEAECLNPRQTDRLVQRVLGHAFVWGQVVECEDGWRAGRAYPAHLYVVSSRWRRWRLGRPRRTPNSAEIDTAVNALAIYGVPIQVLDVSSSRELLTAIA
jgi:hypothetical protein